MLGPIFDAVLAFIVTYGAVALLAVFVLEGALVGKLIPTRTLFVAAVLAVGVDAVAFLPMVAAAVVGATIGQLVVFVSVRRYEIDPGDLPVVPDEGDGLTSATRWFDRWGLPAVALTNALPGTRGWLAVPSAGSRVSTSRFAVASFTGSTVYATGLLAVAFGLSGAFEFVTDGSLLTALWLLVT